MGSWFLPAALAGQGARGDGRGSLPRTSLGIGRLHQVCRREGGKELRDHVRAQRHTGAAHCEYVWRWEHPVVPATGLVAVTVETVGVLRSDAGRWPPPPGVPMLTCHPTRPGSRRGLSAWSVNSLQTGHVGGAGPSAHSLFTRLILNRKPRSPGLSHLRP